MNMRRFLAKFAKKPQDFSNQNQNNNNNQRVALNLEMMFELMQESYPKIESVKGKKNVVLVIGNTGAGKSTAINYLLDYPIRWEVDDDGELFSVPDEQHPKYKTIEKYAGMASKEDGNNSVTFYPEAYGNKDDEFTHLDSPGFMGNNIQEIKICESINTQIGIQLAENNVRAIMVIIDDRSLFEGKAFSVRHLSETLSKLFRSVEEIAPSILFCITKPQPLPSGGLREASHVLYRIKKVIQTEKDKIEAIENSLGMKITDLLKIFSEEKNLPEERSKGLAERKEELEDIYARLYVLELMQQNEENVLVLNARDNGESRTSVTNRLRYLVETTKPISISHFNFSSYDETRTKFNEAIFDIASSGKKTIEDKLRLSPDLGKLKNEIKQKIDSIKNCESEMMKLSSTSVVIASDDLEIQKISESEKLQKLEDEIKLKKDETTILDKEKKEFEKQKAEIDTDELIQYGHAAVREPISPLLKILLFFIGRYFEYEGIPFDKVTVAYYGHSKLNSFDELIYKPEKGLLKVRLYRETFLVDLFNKQSEVEYIYVSDEERLIAAKKERLVADMIVFVQKRNLPDNKKLIQDIDEKLKNYPEKIKKLEDEKNILENQKQDVSKILTMLNENIAQEKIRAVKIEQLEKQKTQCEQDIPLLKDKFSKLENELKWVEEMFNKNKSLYVVTYKIVSVLHFDSALVNEFRKQYQRCPELPQEKLISETNSNNNNNNNNLNSDSVKKSLPQTFMPPPKDNSTSDQASNTNKNTLSYS